MRRRRITRDDWALLTTAERFVLWPAITQTERNRLTDKRGLTPQLIGLEGWRVEVVALDGSKRRFNVARAGAWAPVHVEMANTTSTSGRRADERYAQVRPLRNLTTTRKRP